MADAGSEPTYAENRVPPPPWGVGHVQAGIFFVLYEGPRWGQHIPAEGVQVCCRQSL